MSLATTLAAVKVLLAISDTSKDAILTFYINKITQTALNYCGIEEFPAGLEYWLQGKVIAWYNANGSAVGAEATAGAVSSIKRGDFSVSFAGDGSGAFAGSSIENLGAADKTELNPFRIIEFI
jgi:hypothetical protein